MMSKQNSSTQMGNITIFWIHVDIWMWTIYRKKYVLYVSYSIVFFLAHQLFKFNAIQ